MVVRRLSAVLFMRRYFTSERYNFVLIILLGNVVMQNINFVFLLVMLKF